MTAAYRVVLVCTGLPLSAGSAAACIQDEFALQRPHHRNVRCTFSDGALILLAENDFDGQGLALRDEFSDVISACVAEPFDGEISVRSIERL